MKFKLKIKEDNCIDNCELAKIGLITAFPNPWPKIGDSAVERVKTRLWSTMENDMLNSLLHISINGPPANGKEADQL